MVQYISLPSSSIVVPEKIFLSRAGISPSAELPRKLREDIEKVENICRELSEPKAVYDTLNFKTIDKKKFKVDSEEFMSEMVNRVLENCTKVTLIAATIGKKVSEKIDLFFQEDQYSLAFLLDAFASEFVEYFVNKVDEFLRQDMMRKGWIGSKRISPGYEDLDLKTNLFITQRLDTKHTIGVEIVENSYMLTPRKSITALIGWKRFQG